MYKIMINKFVAMACGFLCRVMGSVLGSLLLLLLLFISCLFVLVQTDLFFVVFGGV